MTELNSKKILRFYFSADNLNDAMNNLIDKYAYGSVDNTHGCEYYADKVIELINKKDKLSLLWGYINGVMQGFSDYDASVLLAYSSMRVGISKLSKDVQKEIRRVVIRFSRKAERGIARFDDAVRIVNEYYHIMKV